MTITVTFESIEEMRAAAKELLGMEAKPLEHGIQLPYVSPVEIMGRIKAPAPLPDTPQVVPTDMPVQSAMPQGSLTGTATQPAAPQGIQRKKE